MEGPGQSDKGLMSQRLYLSSMFSKVSLPDLNLYEMDHCVLTNCRSAPLPSDLEFQDASALTANLLPQNLSRRSSTTNSSIVGPLPVVSASRTSLKNLLQEPPSRTCIIIFQLLSTLNMVLGWCLSRNRVLDKRKGSASCHEHKVEPHWQQLSPITTTTFSLTFLPG